MKREDSDKLIENDIKELLKKMHNGESLIVTLGRIMEIFKGARYVEERKFIYLLQGLHQDKRGGLPDMSFSQKEIDAYNEAVDENNFAVKLAISAIMGEE